MIISLEEAKEALRLDGDHNDGIIVGLIESVPDYLEVHTGHRWTDPTEQGHSLAKTTAKLLLKLWYFSPGKDSEKLERTVRSMVHSLSNMAAMKEEEDG